MGNKPTYDELEQLLRELTSGNESLNLLHRTIVDNSIDAIFLTAPDGKVFFANQAACDLFQMTCQEIINGGRDAVVDTNDPRFPIALEERSRTGIFRGELNCKKKDGTIFPTEISSSIFSNSQGQQLTSTVVRDISTQKQLEEKSTASELWMRCIFNSLEEGVFVVSPDRVFVNINTAAEKIFGYSSGELLGKSTEVLHVTPQHYKEFGKRINEAFESGEIAQFEFELKRKNGEIFPSEHTVSLLKEDTEKKLGIVSVVRDISRQKQQEEEKEKLISDLQNALAEIKKLSGLLPICSICKKIRNDEGYWDILESYIQEHSEAIFSHSICPECAKKHYSELDIDDE